jgi:endo-1,4-beta-xylanase
MEKTILTCAVFMLLVFAGCSEDSIDNEFLQEDVPGLQLKGYSSGTHDGFFWFLWTDDRGGSVNYSNGSGGNYSVSWNYSGNFTCGKGWSYGDYSRVIGIMLGLTVTLVAEVLLTTDGHGIL